MTKKPSIDLIERYGAVFIAVLIVIVLIAQARLLYIFPQPDSARWWGDETGQMLELRTELQDGYARIPTAYGSSLAITNGFVRGNSWFAAAIYGVPALLFSNVADVVVIGRTITFVLSLGLILLMYRMLRASQVPRVLSLSALLLLVSTRSFFFSSHAARLDVAAGIVVLAFVWYLSSRYDALEQSRWRPTLLWYFGYGAAVVVFATLSIHLLTLLGALSLYTVWRFRAFHKLSFIGSAIGGVVVMLGLLIAIYSISGSPFSLYSPSSAPNQFQTVTAELPILRPFSRSVQVANIIERVHGLWVEAPAFLVFIFIAIPLSVLRRASAQKSNTGKWISGSALVIAVAWLLFQSPALYYYIQVLPLFIVWAVMDISKRWKSTLIVNSIVVSICILLCVFAVMDTVRAERTSRKIDRDNHTVIAEALDSVRSNTNSGAPPLVLAQNPAIAMLEHDKRVHLMSAHIVSFPTSSEPIASILLKLHVNYLLLYAAHGGLNYSADYHTLRPIADSIGAVILRKPGVLFDVDRDYFSASALRDESSRDTLILYKLPSIAH